MRENSFLETALQIGRRLCADAIWSEGMCAWLGDSHAGGRGKRQTLNTISLNHELYGGTSGVALFLARLGRLADDRIVRKTALAAARHALRRISFESLDRKSGFYDGRMGAGWALIHVGESLTEPELVECGVGVLTSMATDPDPDCQTDIIAGAAGMIAGLLGLHDARKIEPIVQRTNTLADSLAEGVVDFEYGSAWRMSSERQDRPPLTGFAHGAAGIVWALTELTALRPNDPLNDLIKRGLAYERHWFQTSKGNWPDLRHVDSEVRPADSPPPCMTAWCHGAPGIGLARLRMFELTGDPELKKEAEIATETTAAWLRRFLETGAGNFSLCHGVAGNAETLIVASRVLKRPDLLELACEVGERGLELYGGHKRAWPCGFNTEGYTPGLMLGWAGTGYFYLRLYDPERTPSILLPGVS